MDYQFDIGDIVEFRRSQDEFARGRIVEISRRGRGYVYDIEDKNYFVFKNVSRKDIRKIES